MPIKISKYEPSQYDGGYTIIDTGEDQVVASFDINNEFKGRPPYLVLNIDPSNGNYGTAQVIENIKALLEKAGIDDFEVKTDRNAGITMKADFGNGGPNKDAFAIRFKALHPGDLTKIAGALSDDVDLERGKTVYGLLNNNVVMQILEEEQKMHPSHSIGYKITSAPIHEGGQAYIDIENTIPGSIISILKQSGQMSKSADNNPTASYELTDIHFNGRNRTFLSGLLDKAGIEYDAYPEYISAQAPINQVVELLAANELMPQSAVETTKTAFSKVRPDGYYKHEGTAGSGQAVFQPTVM